MALPTMAGPPRLDGGLRLILTMAWGRPLDSASDRGGHRHPDRGGTDRGGTDRGAPGPHVGPQRGGQASEGQPQGCRRGGCAVTPCLLYPAAALHCASVEFLRLPPAPAPTSSRASPFSTSEATWLLSSLRAASSRAAEESACSPPDVVRGGVVRGVDPQAYGYKRMATSVWLQASPHAAGVHACGRRSLLYLPWPCFAMSRH